MKLLYLSCLALLGMLLSAPASATDSAVSSPRQYCASSSPTTLFLVDRTTKFDSTDTKDLDDGLYSTIKGLSAGDRIVIRTIIDDPFASERVFDGCLPGCVTHTWWERMNCSDLAARSDVYHFYRTASESVRALRGTSEDHSRSDIFETLAVLGNEYHDAQLQHVVLYSDLLQNTKRVPTDFILRAHPDLVLRRLTNEGLSGRFPGTDVLAFGVGRTDGPTRRGLTIKEWQNLQSVWTAWFKQGGARSVQIYQWYPKPR